jgi:hydrogenase-4 component E
MEMSAQLINLMASLMLLIAFAMLAQRRILSLVYLFAWQGAVLALNSVIVAWYTGHSALYVSAFFTILLKVIALPIALRYLIHKLDIVWDVETLINIPTTLLAGLVLVVFAFNLAVPISQLAGTITRGTLGIAIAVVLLAFLMMITRRKAVPQVIGFLAMENGLFFAATSATYGMPMVVELGILLDVIVGVLILGIFFFQVREAFDSLDLKHMEKLKESSE